jgi:hypothetical protein
MPNVLGLYHTVRMHKYYKSEVKQTITLNYPSSKHKQDALRMKSRFFILNTDISLYRFPMHDQETKIY